MIANKVKTREDLISLCDVWRRQGFIIGFTSGAFDILHAGHVDYLEKARKKCDILIVGLNSDQSVKRYKGANRPIISEEYRLKTVAALESVDYVFLFDERRNEKNIRALKPAVYFKAGDYSPEKLTSGSVIEEFGGRAEIIPIADTISTSSIVQKILSASGGEVRYQEDEPDIGHFKIQPAKMRPAVFLDRDGTINREKGYIGDPEQFEFLPNALDGMKRMMDMDYRLIIVTNQGGIGLGYFDKTDFYRVTGKMLRGVSEAGILIDKILFCPHSLADSCECRKPATGLLKQAEQDLNIDMKHSFFIGDRLSDIETGVNAGMKTILIAGTVDELQGVRPDFIAHDLVEAATIILAEERKSE